MSSVKYFKACCEIMVYFYFFFYRKIPAKTPARNSRQKKPARNSRQKTPARNSRQKFWREREGKIYYGKNLNLIRLFAASEKQFFFYLWLTWAGNTQIVFFFVFAHDISLNLARIWLFLSYQTIFKVVLETTVVFKKWKEMGGRGSFLDVLGSVRGIKLPPPLKKIIQTPQSHSFNNGPRPPHLQDLLS